MVGTPAEVADQLESFFDFVGGDGFMLSPTHSPGAIEEFVASELEPKPKTRQAGA